MAPASLYCRRAAPLSVDMFAKSIIMFTMSLFDWLELGNVGVVDHGAG
jgi:hypothetical protein